MKLNRFVIKDKRGKRMGMTFSNIQVQNRKKINADEFAALLSKHIKTMGLVPATEDDAEFSFSFIFSKNNDWISVIPPEEAGANTAIGNTREIARSLAKLLKTACIFSEVVDSDMVIINYFNEKGVQKDNVFIGVSDFLGESEADNIAAMMGFNGDISGNREIWEQLLDENHTWEELQEVWNRDYVFKEEVLFEMASLFGMDIDTINDVGENMKDRMIISHFKKKGVKKTSFNAVFRDVFGDALKPLGFLQLKGRYPYFVRVVGDEILHIIAANEKPVDYEGTKEFAVYGGIATVYRSSIDLTINPREILRDIPYLSGKNGNTTNPTKSLYFSYKDDMSNEIHRALELTKEIVLPLISSAVDIDSCIDYFRKIDSSLLTLCNANKGIANLLDFYYTHEGLLLIKQKDCNDSVEEYKKKYLNPLPDHIKIMQNHVSIRDEFLNSDEKYKAVLEELARRKNSNIEILRSYGLSI